MPMLLRKPTTASGEPDVAWPPSVLDMEPEPLHCVHHGDELPCGTCADGSKQATRKES